MLPLAVLSRAVLSVLVSGLLATLPATPRLSASPPANVEYRVVFASATHIVQKLDELGRDGYACVTLAQPEPGSRVPGVVAIVGRTSGTNGPIVGHRAILGGRDDMKVPLTQAGSEGFRLCGVVLDEESSIARDVAVMTNSAPGKWHYDVEVLLRYKESLARLNTAGRDGFVPVAAAAIDNNRVPDQRNWMVVAERSDAIAAPVEVTVRSDPSPTGLGQNLNDSGKQGYRVDLLWKEGNDYVAMMSRPAGQTSPARAYAVEGDAPSRMHFLHGLALADFPYLDRRLFVSDSGVRASNELIVEPLPPLGVNGVVDARGATALGTIGDHISRNHGYEVSYARVGRDSGKMVLSVAMAKKD